MATPSNKTPNRRKDNKQRKTPKSESKKSQPQNDVFTKKQDPEFEDYWNKTDVSNGLKRGTLIQGTLRISQKDFNEAYIDDPLGGPDYYVPSVWARNRAMEGDVVVVEVMPPDQWKLYKESNDDDSPGLFEAVLSTLKKVNVKDPPSDAPLPHNDLATPTTNEEEEAHASQPTLIDVLTRVKTKKPGDSPAKPKLNHLYMGKDLRKYRRTAKVVYIVSREHSQACAGHVKVFNKALGKALFSPRDGRSPRIIIPLSSMPEDFPRNCSKYENTLFICRILDWARDSPFPSGALYRSLGEAGELEPETECILAEYEIFDEEFSEEVLSVLPSEEPWAIPQEEIARRRDFRSDCVLSIDPSTARDLDDALHCKEIRKGVYEVGVHIADVSYFVEPDTPLDREAARRATSVYLVQKVIPMLPRRLCEDLCSLNPHKERLTFSVVWTLSLKGELLDEWMGRSIICSRAKLSYGEAQLMIDSPTKDWTLADFPSIANSESVCEVVWSVVTLNKIAKVLSALRKMQGTLKLDQAKLEFSLDKETGLPNGCHIHQHNESNKLIEEFMLLANMAVAHRISEAFPGTALLRRHPPPKGRNIEALRDQSRMMGVSLDISSAGALQHSLLRYTGRTVDEATTLMERQVVVNMCCKAMELAVYFCTGYIEKEEHYGHYALNVPRYTHFTSPIRRYADVLVHRLLGAALDVAPPFTFMCDDVAHQADVCNKKKKNAKTAGELSIKLFLGVFIRECGPLRYRAIVTGILDRALDVMIPELATIRRIYCQKLPLKDYQYNLIGDQKEPHLILKWNDMAQVDVTIMSVVDVVLKSVNNSIQFEASIEAPST